MPGHRQDDWQTRIKAVEKEFLAAERAAGLLLSAVRRDPSNLPNGVTVGDVAAMAGSLEATYIVRLFATFEAGLRSYWEVIRGSTPRARDLIDGIAAYRGVSDAWKGGAHAVRAYRNNLVHEGDEIIEPIPLRTARHHLCSFLSMLPRQW